MLAVETGWRMPKTFAWGGPGSPRTVEPMMMMMMMMMMTTMIRQQLN